MKRLFVSLIALAAVPMFAADVITTLQQGRYLPYRIAVGEPFSYLVEWQVIGEVAPSDIVVEVDVPGVVTQFFKTDGMSCTQTSPIRCTFTELQNFSSVAVTMRVDTPGRKTTTARVIHQNGPDSNPANDVRTHEFEAVALPSVRLFQYGLLPNRLDPGQHGTFSVTAQNRAATPATNVVLTITLPSGGTFESASDPTCTVSETSVTCPRASLAQDQNLTVEVGYAAPFRTSGEDLFVEAKVTSAEEDVDPTDNEYRRSVMMPRQFVVENVQDQGSGTLRQAIHDLTALCAFNEPCEIAFRIPAPVPANGWFTIKPRTPLPQITGNVIIDGGTQTAFTGDTNDGPEIEIDGTFLAEESGLRLRTDCSMTVRNLAVNGFPGYGIEVRRQFEGFGTDRCFALGQLRLEAHIANNHLAGNQRGLGLFTVFAEVHDNVISGNHRAGIYAVDSHYAEIRRNTIANNGAGIFFDMDDPLFGFPGGADVVENVISNNQGMAIARTRRGEIEITDNSIFDNLLQGIDVNLDGPTPNREADTDVPNRPVLVSATYDPVLNATIVRGRLDSNAFPSLVTYVIHVYASSRLSVWGYPQAETRLRQLILASGHEEFEVFVPGDLRGQWITATNTALHFVGFARTPGTESHRTSRPGDTSELSNAVGVQ